jgi:hypothetical protein
VSNSRIFGSLAVAVDTDPAKKALRNSSVDRVTRKNFFIGSLLLFGMGFIKSCIY